MSEEPLLRVASLTKKFGGLAAVDNVSLQVSGGELTGLIGPNGAGKTTLFNLLTGFLRPDSGSVVFMGKEITRASTASITTRGVARTFQLVRPFQKLTVTENVLVPAVLSNRRGTPRRSAEEVAAEVVSLVGLERRSSAPANTLTHAELKMLEIARAVATRPRLLLLDEPYGGLGSTEVGIMTTLIQRLSREQMTIVIIEHRLRELMKSVRRVVVMDQGSLIADGAPMEIVKMSHVISAYLGSSGQVVS